jgi:hypothetical protein
VARSTKSHISRRSGVDSSLYVFVVHTTPYKVLKHSGGRGSFAGAPRGESAGAAARSSSRRSALFEGCKPGGSALSGTLRSGRGISARRIDWLSAAQSFERAADGGLELRRGLAVPLPAGLMKGTLPAMGGAGSEHKDVSSFRYRRVLITRPSHRADSSHLQCSVKVAARHFHRPTGVKQGYDARSSNSSTGDTGVRLVPHSGSGFRSLLVLVRAVVCE